MSAETAAQPGQNPSSEQTTEARRSPLRDFLRGAALIFDFDGGLSRSRISTNRYATDAEALASDWHAVGRDLHRAMGTHPPNPPKS